MQEGFAPLEKRVTLRESERRALALELEALARGGGADDSRPGRALGGWVTGAAGIAGLLGTF